MEERYPTPRRIGASCWNDPSDHERRRAAGDHALLQAARNGDEQALLELMKRHKETIFRFAFRYNQDEGAAAEVVEKTFVRFFLRPANHEPSATVSASLLSIAADVCRESQLSSF